MTIALTFAGKHFLQTCRVLFERADTDGSGGLDSDEFVKVLKSKTLNLRLTKKEIIEIKKIADKDEDGVITFDEFVPVVEQLLNRVAAKKKKSTVVRPSWRHAKDMALCSVGQSKFPLATTAMAAFRRMKPKALDVFQLRRHGQRAFVENRHSDAEQIMQMAVELSSRLCANSPQHLGCLARLAKVMTAQGKIIEGISIYTECLERIAKNPNQTGNLKLRAECSLCVSKACADVGQVDTAIEHCKRAIATVDYICRSEDDAKHDVMLVPYLKWQVRVLERSDDIKGLTAAQARFIEVTIRRLERQEKETIEEAQRASLIREVLNNQKAMDIEKAFADESLKRVQETNGQRKTPDDESGRKNFYRSTAAPSSTESECDLPSVKAGTLYSLGRMLMKQGQLDEAEPLLRQAISLFECIHGTSNRRVAHGYVSLAGCLAARTCRSRRGAALMYLDRATNILVGKGKHLDAAEPGGPMSVKSKVLQMLGQLKRAVSLLNQVHTILSTHLGPAHAKTVEVADRIRELNEKRSTRPCRRAGAVARSRDPPTSPTSKNTIERNLVCPECGSKHFKLWVDLDNNDVQICHGCYEAEIALRFALPFTVRCEKVCMHHSGVSGKVKGFNALRLWQRAAFFLAECGIWLLVFCASLGLCPTRATGEELNNTMCMPWVTLV
eukprot:m.25550 g.25550  ORF g.25550 m.25550 type:complete len:669 (-) comp13202_c0_seq1:303-2309(-)